MNDFSPEDMLQQFSRNGWAGLDGLSNQMGDQAIAAGQRRRELAEAMARIFATPDGELMFQHLQDVSVGRSTVPEAFAAGEAPWTLEQLMPRLIWREAQNAFCKSLFNLVAEGRRLAPKPKSGR